MSPPPARRDAASSHAIAYRVDGFRDITPAWKPDRVAAISSVTDRTGAGARSWKAALVQDRRKRDDANLAGELGIVECDPPGAVGRTQRDSDARREHAPTASIARPMFSSAGQQDP
jgi:hypothetical protein